MPHTVNTLETGLESGREGLKVFVLDTSAEEGIKVKLRVIFVIGSISISAVLNL